MRISRFSWSRTTTCRASSLVLARSLAAHGRRSIDLGRDGVGPDSVALFGEVEEVGHDLFGDRAVLFEELVGDVEVAHAEQAGARSWLGRSSQRPSACSQ